MKQKVKDLLHILVIYLIALFAAIITLKYTPISDILVKTAIADFVAMVIVFMFSVRFNNSSVYDPYWSAAPVFIILYWLFNSQQFAFYYKVMWIIIIVWGVRLTWNWIHRWDGFHDEDWRYKLIRKKTGKMYWVVSFFGIHLFPTAIVFAGLVPFYYAFNANVFPPTSWFTVVAVFFTLSGIYLERTADETLRRFQKDERNDGYLLHEGVWTFFKYPNYLGEIIFWWGLYFISVVVDHSLWWTVFGPLAITLMFMFISIPMMKKRLKDKKPQQLTK